MRKKASPTLVGVSKRIVEEVLAIPEDIRLKDTQIFYKLYILIAQINGKKYTYEKLEKDFYEIRNLRITDLRKVASYVIEGLAHKIKKSNSNVLNMGIIYALDILGYSLNNLPQASNIKFLKDLYLCSEQEDVLNLAVLSENVIKEKINLKEGNEKLKIRDRLVKKVYNSICAKKFNSKIFDNLSEMTYLLKSGNYSRDLAEDIMPILSGYNQKECEIFIDKLSYTLIAKIKEPDITAEKSIKIIYALDITGYLDRLHKQKGALQVTKFAYKLYRQLDHEKKNFRKKFKNSLEISKELDMLATSAKRRFTKK